MCCLRSSDRAYCRLSPSGFQLHDSSGFRVRDIPLHSLVHIHFQLSFSNLPRIHLQKSDFHHVCCGPRCSLGAFRAYVASFFVWTLETDRESEVGISCFLPCQPKPKHQPASNRLSIQPEFNATKHLLLTSCRLARDISPCYRYQLRQRSCLDFALSHRSPHPSDIISLPAP